MLRIADFPARTADRRARFLRVANRCWLGLGFLAVLVWPFYATETLFVAILAGSTTLTFLGVEALLRRGRTRAPPCCSASSPTRPFST